MTSLAALYGLGQVFSTSAGKVTALRDITAEIAPGVITGVVGPDGAGKTTLLRHLAGLLRPSTGRVEVLGHDMARDAALAHPHIGYMPQRFGLYEDLSVAENFALFADLHGLNGAVREERSRMLLEFTGLAPFTARLASALSGGMKQKLGLACALLSRPQLLLLDEPSVGVDPASRRELWRIVERMMRRTPKVRWAWSGPPPISTRPSAARRCCCCMRGNCCRRRRRHRFWRRCRGACAA